MKFTIMTRKDAWSPRVHFGQMEDGRCFLEIQYLNGIPMCHVTFDEDRWADFQLAVQQFPE